MKRTSGYLAAAAALAAGTVAALAADGTVLEEIPFAGGTIAITENADYEKVVTFNGEELGRDFYAALDRLVDISGTDVALLSLGPGGNACPGYSMIVWPNGEGGVRTVMPEDTCGSPPPAVTGYDIAFVPYVGPGEEAAVERWTPMGGLRTVGMMRFAPDPGTGWADLRADPAIHPYDYFSNAALYDLAAGTLGGDLQEYAVGLRTAAKVAQLGDGLWGTRGCVPHNCGGADSFLIVDPDAGQGWFAQMRGTAISHWPDIADWPDEARAALETLSAQ